VLPSGVLCIDDFLRLISIADTDEVMSDFLEICAMPTAM
jgi:hypothetical protein